MVSLIDTTLRDGAQAHWSGRLSVERVLPIILSLDKAGFRAMDFMAALQFEISAKFLKENPWERVRVVRQAIKETPLITHIRSRSLLSFDLMPLDVIRLYIERLAANGFDRIMVFDALHDITNMEPSIRYARDVGMQVTAVIFYTISPFHTDEYYASVAGKFLHLNVDSVCLRDPSGLLTPERTRTLIPILRNALGEIPLELKSHCTTGLAPECYTEAMKAGVDALFVASAPLANGPSVPASDAVVEAAKQEGIDCSLDEGRLAEIAETVNGALIQVDEAADQLRGYVSDLNLDPERLEWLEQRMGAIHDLARKHRTEPDQLPAVAAAVSEELDRLEHADEHLDQLAEQCRAQREAYLEAAGALSEHRHAVAERLSQQVSDAMETLGMTGGRFHVDVNRREPDAESGEGFSPTGLDRIEFRVSANPGQSPRPLSKVASGGELSRISLAIQMITAANEPIPTLIFDEVDAGVGGGIAEIVGAQLRRLGNQRQVLCVTHLPQVASQAHNHFRVSKDTDKDNTETRTRVYALDDEQRIGEIARMLGGLEITETTRDHAEEMIRRAEKAVPDRA
jgi:hypothetical protein